MHETPQDSWSFSEDETGALRLRGEIDYTVAAAVRQTLLDRIARGGGPVVLILDQLTYLDSSGLAVLIEARRRALERGRSLELRELSAPVIKLLKLTKVEKLFGLA